jgi:hypothetical protein
MDDGALFASFDKISKRNRGREHIVEDELFSKNR